MDNINIDNTLYHFKVTLGFSGIKPIIQTKFYLGYKISNRRRFLIFGKLVHFKVWNFAFSIPINILSANYDKETVREFIECGIKYKERKIEIERGQII